MAPLTSSTETQGGEQAPTPEANSANWALPVSELAVEDSAPDAANLTVEGRSVAGTVDGFGRLWRTRCRVRLTGADVTPEVVMKTWKDHFEDFWPGGNRFVAPTAGIKHGEAAVVDLEVPGGGKFLTGVHMLYTGDASFILMTPKVICFPARSRFPPTTREASRSRGLKSSCAPAIRCMK